MMRSPDLVYWVESPHLFYDPDVLKLLPKDLEKAEKPWKEAPSKKDALEQINNAYMSMYCSVQALLHSIQYKTTHMRCIVTVLEDYFIKHGIIERDLLDRFLRSQSIEGTPEENFQAAEAWLNKVKSIVKKMTGYAWHYTFLGIFFLIVTVFAMLPLVAARAVRPRKPSIGKQDPYECGMEKVGDAWIQFKIQYYLYALVFIVFDVEVVLIVPWAVVFKQLGFFAFVEMAIFLLILFVGLIYVWRKRDLEWY